MKIIDKKQQNSSSSSPSGRPGGALRLFIPEKLSELSPDQLRYISRLYLMGYSETEFLVKALFYLTGLKLLPSIRYATQGAALPEREAVEGGSYWCTHDSMKKPFVLDANQISEMKKAVDYLLQSDEVKPLSWIGFARARQYRLYNATFEEYLMAENYYFAYIETKKDEHLDNLISCLYRRPWHQWNAEKIQKRAKQFRNVDPAIKYTVFMWYIGFRTYVPKRCKALFSSKGSGKRRPFNPREYINGMIHQLNNGDITIKEKLLKQPIWDALDELEQRAIDFESSLP